MPDVTGLLDRFEEEAQKDGKASAKLVDTTVRQVKSDYAPQYKNDERLSATWSAIASEIGNLAKKGLQAKKVDDIKRTQDDLADLEKRIKETPEFQPLLIATQDLLEQINPIIVKRAEYVGSAEQNLKRFSSFVGEKSLGFIEGIARSTIGGIPGGSFLLDKTFGALKRGAAARKTRQERGLSIAAAFSSAAVSDAPAGGGTERVDTGDGGGGSAGMQQVGGETKGQQMERVREEEREEDKRWRALMILLNNIFKALGGKAAARKGGKGMKGIPEDDDSWLETMLQVRGGLALMGGSGLLGLGGLGGKSGGLLTKAKNMVTAARTTVAATILGGGATTASLLAKTGGAATGTRVPTAGMRGLGGIQDMRGAGQSFFQQAGGGASKGTLQQAGQKAASKFGSKMMLGVLGRMVAPAFAIGELGVDIFDVAASKEEMAKDIRANVKKADTFAIAGSIIGGALGMWVGNPWLGAMIGNAIFEQLGAALDEKDISTIVSEEKAGLKRKIEPLGKEVANLEEQLKATDLSVEYRMVLQSMLDSKNRQLKGLKDELAGFEQLKEEEDARDKAVKEANAIRVELIESEKLLKTARSLENKEERKQAEALAGILQESIMKRRQEAEFKEAKARAQLIMKGKKLGLAGFEDKGQIDVHGMFKGDKDVTEMQMPELDEEITKWLAERTKFIEEKKGKEMGVGELKTLSDMNVMLHLMYAQRGEEVKRMKKLEQKIPIRDLTSKEFTWEGQKETTTHEAKAGITQRFEAERRLRIEGARFEEQSKQGKLIGSDEFKKQYMAEARGELEQKIAALKTEQAAAVEEKRTEDAANLQQTIDVQNKLLEEGLFGSPPLLGTLIKGQKEEGDKNIEALEKTTEGKEVLAKERTAELAEKLIEKYGKGAQYWMKGEGDASYRIKGGEEGTAEQAIKLMAKIGGTEFEHIWGMQKDMYGKMGVSEFEEMGKTAPSTLTFLKDAMPELTGMFGEIKEGKKELIAMKTGGYSIPFEDMMKNQGGMGNALNLMQMQKEAMQEQIGGAGAGGSFVNAPTIAPQTSNIYVTHNNMMQQNNISERDKMGRGIS